MALAVMDTTITLTPTFINAGIWAKKNQIIFQTSDNKSKTIIFNHEHAGSHPHMLIVKEVKCLLQIES